MPASVVNQTTAPKQDSSVAQDRAVAAKLVEEAEKEGKVKTAGSGSGSGVYWVFGGLAVACVVGHIIHQ